METRGRDVPLRAAAHHAVGLPDNVMLLWLETTRSRRCHLQLGCVCFLPCLTLPQLEEGCRVGCECFVESLGWKGWGAFCSSAWEDRELLGGTGGAVQVFSLALQQLLVASFLLLLSFPFPPNFHLQPPLNSLDGMTSSSFRPVRCLSDIHQWMWGDRSLRVKDVPAFPHCFYGDQLMDLLSLLPNSLA